jgi:hypothetical protein
MAARADLNVAPIPRLALSPAELGASLGKSEDYVAEHVAPELKWVRRGRCKLVAVTEVQRWLDESAARTLEGRP